MVIAAGIVVIAAAAAGGYRYYRRDTGIVVTTDIIKARDLEAVVSASGKIQPKRLVNISADTPGRVVDLAVNEGDIVHEGQFLLQIDPRSLRTRVDSGSASLQAAQMSLDQMRQAAATARVQLDQAQQTLKRQQDLWARQLTTREALDKATNDVKAAESAVQEREHAAEAQASRIKQERAGLESARYDLSKVRIESPIEGIVTRRNIQEGETAVVGTMNNAGTVLLTLADMSVIQAEVEVDETNIPSVHFGQKATVTIDAIPDKSFTGHVAEIGNSPIQTNTAGAANTAQATNFKVVVVLDEEVPDVRPGFTATADIVTATRSHVISVPIPAVAVRELIYEANGDIVRPPPRDKRTREPADPAALPIELQPGQTRRETEGVFIIENGRARFVPIRVGIAGDRYFEVLSGLEEGTQVITGPYNSVRGMADGDEVKVDPKGSGAAVAVEQ
jgi:HlyD family secretion protein